MIAGNVVVASASHRSSCTGLYMNRSRCHEDIHRPLGVGFDKTSSKFPFRIFGQRMESVSSGVTVGVQYLGEGGVLD